MAINRLKMFVLNAEKGAEYSKKSEKESFAENAIKHLSIDVRFVKR
jgi:hypothetical protein